tara:strand:- start:339 stop:494 length:156 start_codon:yes stop_codon:yes gene_type:complete
MSRGANERQVFFNIDRAREEAALAASPQGLTALGKGFWYRNQEQEKRRNRR